jgi:hypothetical protein
MRLGFGYLRVFTADWKRLGLDDDDLRALELAVMENPSAGRIIPGAGGLRKIRFAPPGWNRGKSGAVRVCYVYFALHETAFMLAAFAKNEQENITPADKAAYRALIRGIEAGLAGRERWR